MRAQAGSAFLLFALVISAAGCDKGGAAATGWSVTMDTTATGVVRVVNSPPSSGIDPGWTLQPELRIGSVSGDGADLFGQIKGIAPLTDGGVAVLDAQAQEIRVFNAAGEHVRTLGGRGTGPGELNDANGMLIGPDGLLRVNDPRNNRISLFDPESGFVRSSNLEISSYGWVWNAAVDSTNHTIEPTLAVLPDGRWDVVRVLDAEGSWSDTIRIGRREDAPSTTEAPGTYIVEIQNGRMFISVPFWPAGAAALDPRRYLWQKSSHINDYRIAQVTFAQDTILLFESRRAPLRVTSVERDSMISTIRDIAAGSELDWSRIPDDRPIVETILLDSRGRVWVQVRATRQGTTYDVFGRDGIYEGTVETELQILSSPQPVIVGDVLHGIVTDELGIQYVVRARLAPLEKLEGAL